MRNLLLCLFLFVSCNLQDRKLEKPKYVVDIKTEMDTSTYYCDSFLEKNNCLILYRAVKINSDSEMILTIKSDDLKYKIKLNK